MQDEDSWATDLVASATGILECLRMLADEATKFQLDDTLLALQRAFAAGELERGRGKVTERFAEAGHWASWFIDFRYRDDLMN
ncbi:MAG: hypothetical protein EXR09_08330 [Acetobacteraceae bacterium]|nr:hypothetical protein [Acetobacteraceae bacterium]